MCGALVTHAHAGTNVSVVSSLADLSADVDVAFTNSVLTRVILPGMGGYTNSLGVVAYDDAFETNFLAVLPSITNLGVDLRPIEVRETTNSPRQRYYFSCDGIAVHTTAVNIANYPTNWVQSTYGACPTWLTGAARETWFAERDPGRQIVTLFLISTSDVPAWCAAMTNVGHSIPSGSTNLTFLEAYSNDIALAWTTDTAIPDLLAHAPTNVSLLDLYVSTNLMDASAWQLLAALEHVTDPLLFGPYGTEPMAFFAAGNPDLDTDADGLVDVKEFFLTGTDPTLRDTVGDGLGDGARILTYGLSATSPDTDGDGLSDAYEIAAGLSPSSTDTDGDGLSDYAEVVTYFGHTSPTNADSDADGLNDYQEIVVYGTYAAPDVTDARDSDNDGLSDYTEINVSGGDPLLLDTDGDGIDDKYERDRSWSIIDPGNAFMDDDSDGFSNLLEYQWCLDPKISNKVSSTQNLIAQSAGSNAIRRIDTLNYNWAIDTSGNTNAFVRVRPYRKGTNIVDQQLVHTGTKGFFINGVAADAVPSPIYISACLTSVEYHVTANTNALGTNLLFRLQETNGVEGSYCKAYFYVPGLKSVTISVTNVYNASVTVPCGGTGTLWIVAGTDTNAMRVYASCKQTPDENNFYFQTPILYHTDWVLLSASRPGSTTVVATLNQLDWRSAYGTDFASARTRGLPLSPGVYTVNAGVDLNRNHVLDSNEVQQTCNLFAPLADLQVDSDNDGTVSTNDEPVEYAFPGKVIWADKDLYWRTGTNDSDVVEMKINFDAGGRIVPQGCYFVLQWFGNTNTTDNLVDVFLDAACTTPLSRTGWHPAYSNTCGIGHLFDVGDTVPERVYLRASTNALWTADSSRYLTHRTGTTMFKCYRLDTKSLVFEDAVRLCVANRPAVSPKNDLYRTWIEELTSPDRYEIIRKIADAVTNDMTGAGIHVAPYDHRYRRTTEGTCTPTNFLELGLAGILVTSMHGPPGGGVVLPVAFPHDESGYSNALVWANQLDPINARPEDLGCTNYWYVEVANAYFAGAWKPQRDANDAILLASTCYSATGTPSFVASAGGAFACGSTTLMPVGGHTLEGGERLYEAMAKKMRNSNWRTGFGAFCQVCTNSAYRTTGHGRVTLWPAPLDSAGYNAVYPKSYSGATGAITALFDTAMKEQTGTMIKVSAPSALRVRNADLRWVLSDGVRCGLCWPYKGDPYDSATNVFRVVSERCVADETVSGALPKKFAGDGMSCGKNYEWGF
jgi:hypothetical protein